MSEIISKPSRRAPFEELMSKTDIVKIAQHLQISNKEVERAYEKKRFERQELTPEKLMIEKMILLKKLENIENLKLMKFISDDYRKVINDYKVMASSHPQKKFAYLRVKKGIFKEVQRSMAKSIEWRTTAYLLTFDNGPERNMAIRSIGKLFPLLSKKEN